MGYVTLADLYNRAVLAVEWKTGAEATASPMTGANEQIHPGTLEPGDGGTSPGRPTGDPGPYLLRLDLTRVQGNSSLPKVVDRGRGP